MSGKWTLRAVLGLCLVAIGASVDAQAQEARTWPQRPVRLILPFGPASAADIAARLLAERLQVKWGKPIVVEGKPGGDGLLSVGTVVNAKDDHVLFFGPSSAFVVHPYVHENLSYDPEKDLQPIAGVAKITIAIGAPASLGMNSMKDFVAHAKANPGKISYAVAPGFSEFVFNGFVKEVGLQVGKVPYRDITTSPTDLGEGRIQLSMLSFAALRPHAASGRVKILAVNDDKRSAAAPDIPSIVEAGYPMLLATPVLGMLGPRDMALGIRRGIAADVLDVMKDKVVTDRLLATGQPSAPMGVDEFAAALKAQHDQVAKIAKIVGMARKK